MLHISYEDFAIALFVAFALGLCVVSFIVLHEQEKKIEPTDEQVDEACSHMNPFHNACTDEWKVKNRPYAVAWLEAWEAALKGCRK
jgi:predicted lipoprotein